MSDALVVNEIYLSLQGESTFAGLPCVFVRLTGCNLRCSYCDTAYAFKEGQPLTLDGVQADIRRLAKPYESVRGSRRLPLVELTGGEPLLQPATLPLMRSLCDEGWTVLIETSGALDIDPVDKRVHRIMDIKCPSSGEASRNRWENLRSLTAADEIKFVVATQEDYEWMKETLARHSLAELCTILVSWASPLTPSQKHHSLKLVPPGHTPITRQQLAGRIINDALPVRFQLQLHKHIWPPEARGV